MFDSLEARHSPHPFLPRTSSYTPRMATFITRAEDVDSNPQSPGGDRVPGDRVPGDRAPGHRAPGHRALRVAVKDLIDIAGTVTTRGSKVIAASPNLEPASMDAACLRGTRDAVAAGRATIVGKANLHELAYGVTGINPWFGTPVNPLDPNLAPGGSSSGSAVAVGDGEADVAFGTDTGGSIRIPAACCGVVGLKTTWGRVSTSGVAPLAPSLDTVGPMAATVRATEQGMALLEPGFSSAGRARPRRIGRLHIPAAAHIDEAVDAAIDACCQAVDAELVDLTMPGWEKATWAAATVLDSEAWDTYAWLWRTHAADLSVDVAERLEQASKISPSDVDAAKRIRIEWDSELRQAFEAVDLLTLPVLASDPPTLDQASELKRIRCVTPFNLAGLPALALPIPTAKRSAIPVSLQIVGPANAEEDLIAMGLVVEGPSGLA